MTAGLPFVSVIVATFDRPASLLRCLHHLARADYPADRLDVVVVDDGGHVDLDAICARVEGSLAVRLVRQPNGGAAAARNHGVACARGDVLLFTDDDCLAGAGWIRAFVEATRDNPDALVGGHTMNGLSENLCASASQLLANRLCTPGNGTGRPLFLNGNNLATTRAAFESAGGFDTTFRTSAGEDRELSARFQGLGRPLLFAPGAVVEHANPLTCRAFVRQHVNFGRAAFRLRMHPSPRTHVVPFGGPSFYVGLVLMPLEPAASSRWWRVAAVRGLLAVAQLANAAGFLAEWLSPRVRVTETAQAQLRPR